MKKIELTRGQFAKVDNADYDYLNGFQWAAYRQKKSACWRAITMVIENGIWVQKEMARLLLDAKRGETVDHRFHDTLDTRRSKIRLCTQSQNCMNRRLRSDNTSGYKGVFRLSSTGKWQARITVDKRRVHLGTFDDPETAYSAYKKAARKYHGEFACLR